MNGRGEVRPGPARLAGRAWELWRREGFRAMAARARQYVARRRHDGDLACALDAPLPEALVVGQGQILLLSGSCFHPSSPVSRLAIVANGVAHPAALVPGPGSSGHEHVSGFLAQVPFAAADAGLRVELVAEARLRGGRTTAARLGSVALVAAPAGAGEGRVPAPPAPVAICMTTFNPRMELFAAQVQSIRQQTLTDWICLVSDDCSEPETYERISQIVGQDPRFRLSRTAERLGFYHNFERCLGLVPPGTEFVALSDHDDRWHPEKLETLRAEFGADTTLVYSDMNVIDESGHVLSNTYWTTRPNRYDDLASLVLANTVTGAAALFRASLLERLLPFPPRIGEAFHDHWLACLALAMGRIGYVDHPLYDYVQHSSNVLGHYAPAPATAWQEARRVAQVISSGRLRTTLSHWGSVYSGELQKVKLIARLLEMRCAGRAAPEKAQALRRLAGLGESAAATAWLARRGASGLGRVTATLGAESVLLKGLLWHRLARLRARWSRPGAGAAPLEGGNVHGLDRVRQVQEKVAPLRLHVSAAVPARVNLLIPTIDFTYFFGGYIAKFNLARRLAEGGRRVRVVAVDPCADRLAAWKEEVRAFEGLAGVFDRVEVALAGDRTRALEVSPRDVFVATTWWTAHVAHRASVSLGAGAFLYLIQEYEPFTFPMGTFAALARESYDFPHVALFSTELLRDYFRQNRIGVFAGGTEAGECDSLSFQNAITAVGGVRREDIAERSPRRLLFYARPEAHASRNMFELGVLGLSRAVADGAFAGEWEFHGLGTVGGAGRVPLGGGAWLRVQPRQTQEEYRELLRAHDVGLSLMYTPHPSLVPIEMASAGMLVVTNSFDNKTAERLRAISGNMVVVEPTVEGVARGLREAADAVTGYERRLAGSRVQWSTRWDESFDERVMKRLNELLDRLSRR